MNIKPEKLRDEEDSLFEKWKKDYIGIPFVIDGCPNPDEYLIQKNKIIFVLKDGNLGSSFDKETYNQRNELEKNHIHGGAQSQLGARY